MKAGWVRNVALNGARDQTKNESGTIRYRTQTNVGGYPRVKWQASEAQAYRLTSQEWSNCVNNAIQSKVGGYPSDDWKKALNQLHIEERLIEDEPE